MMVAFTLYHSALVVKSRKKLKPGMRRVLLACCNQVCVLAARVESSLHGLFCAHL